MPRNDLIQLRSDTAANWVSVNPTLAVGEIGFETDTGKLKVGTGSTAWNSLLYVTDASDLAGIIPSARISGSYTGITGVGTLSAGDIAATLLSGTIASARISGSYTGITGVGILSAGTWNASLILGQYGGTGVANTGKTITLGGNLTTSGAFTTTLTATANTSVTLPTSGTLATTDASSLASGTLNNLRLPAAATNITSVGTLTALTLSGTVTLPNSANNQIYTSTTADSALPWANGPVLRGATGWSFYSAISASYRMGFRSNTTGTTKYFWTADSALIGQAPADAEVTNTLNVMGTGRFTGTVTAPTFSGALSGNATTAGSSSATTFTGTYVRMSGNGDADPHTEQGLQSGVGGAGAGLALWAQNVAPQFRVGANNPTVYLRNADDTGYQTLEGIITDVSSAHLKQDIETFPQIVHSAGAAVNEDEILTGLNIVRQLRPVSYRWKEKEYLSQLPENPRRVLALSRLNTIRKSKGLEPYDSDELQHDCSRDNCSGTADNPCQWTKNWEIGNIGFISQEVGAIIPQAAILGKEGEFTGLSSLAMTALAVAAIKELDATIQALTERIKQLEESNV